jgi:protein SCO1/2
MSTDILDGFDVGFELTAQDGARVTIDSYPGMLLLVYFGFTHCQTVCPRNLTKLSDAINALDVDHSNLRPLFISVDPDRDSPEVLRHFTSRHFPLFTGLTGTRDDITQAQASFRVFSRARPTPDGGAGHQIAHSSFTYLVGTDGRVRSHFGDSTESADISIRLSAALRTMDPGDTTRPSSGPEGAQRSPFRHQVHTCCRA